MAERTLSYFMRESAKKQEIVEVPGIESIKDEKGEIVPFKIRLLSQQEITDIYDKYKTRTLLKDRKGNPIIHRGQAVYDVESDTNRALRRIIVEALVYPNLKDEQLMKFFDCPSFDDMPAKVFPTAKEYNEVTDIVLSALGISTSENDDEDEVDEAKNS